MTTKPPTLLNDYPVIAKTQLDDTTWVILCWRGIRYEPFVVAHWTTHSPNEWQGGNYFESLVHAVNCFKRLGGT